MTGKRLYGYMEGGQKQEGPRGRGECRNGRV